MQVSFIASIPGLWCHKNNDPDWKENDMLSGLDFEL